MSGTNTEKQLPHDAQAERSVLGACLISPRAVGEAVEVLGEGDAGQFYFSGHQVVWNAIVRLWRAGREVDLVTVVADLEQHKTLENAGGAVLVAELTGASPTSCNVGHYAAIVWDRHVLRELYEVCCRGAAGALDGGQEGAALVDEVEGEVFALGVADRAGTLEKAGAVVPAAFAQLEAQILGRNSVTGLRTGLDDLDRLLGGLQPGDLCILAARPSVGKTAFALNIAANVALEEQRGVYFASLEMSREQLVKRLLCMVGGVDLEKLRDGYSPGQDVQRAQRAADLIYNAPLWIDERVGLSPAALRARVRRWAATEKKAGLVVVDYLQLMTSGGRVENRQTEIAGISRCLKAMAREVGMPVLVLSQLSRDADKHEGGVPQLWHLRESGAIEQDADVVVLMCRPPIDAEDAEQDRVQMFVAKQRNGPTGRVDAVFRKGLQLFVGYTDREPPRPVTCASRALGQREFDDAAEDDEIDFNA
jgi:replicative DNA helicase